MAVEEMSGARSDTFELGINIFMLLDSWHQQEARIHIKLQGKGKPYMKKKNKCYL